MKNFMKNALNKKGKGFTLIELVIVILIIAILAALLIPQLSAMTNKAKTAGVNEAFHEYQIAAESVCVANSGFGAFDDDDASAGTLGTIKAQLNEYLDDVNQFCANKTNAAFGELTRKDPWGHAYKCEMLADDGEAAEATDEVVEVVFTSLGADGVESADDLTTTITYENGSYKVATTGFAVNAK